jgi:UPF0271 protein
MLSVDLNCDLGEGYPDDADLMSLISSANIACGLHAGSIDIMKRTTELALKNNIAIGAHPSFPDREHFGRIDLMESGFKLEELYGILLQQVAQIAKICTEFGTRIRHVKPHGALYNRAARDPEVSYAICKAIAACDNSLLLYGLSGSEMEKQAAKLKIRFVNEAFADRTYCDDGSLTSRDEASAMIEDINRVEARVEELLIKKVVTSRTGTQIPIKCETICIHGDGPHALVFARSIRRTLEQNGIAINRPEPG